jgi:hypothetical protein
MGTVADCIGNHELPAMLATMADNERFRGVTVMAGPQVPRMVEETIVVEAPYRSISVPVRQVSANHLSRQGGRIDSEPSRIVSLAARLLLSLARSAPSTPLSLYPPDRSSVRHTGDSSPRSHLPSLPLGGPAAHPLQVARSSPATRMRARIR